MCFLAVEGLPVHIVVSAAIVTIPLIVVSTFVVNGAVPPAILVGVGHIAMCLIIALGVGVGTVLVGVIACAAPKAILQSRALEVLVVGVELLAFAAANGVGERATVGAVACCGFVMKLGHVDDTYVMLQAQLSSNVQGDVGVWWGVRGLVVRVSDKCRAGEVGMETRHGTAVMEMISDFLMSESPEFLLTLELNFAQADGFLLGDQLPIEIDVCGYSLVPEL